MKKMIINGGLFLIIFSASAAASWMMTVNKSTDTEETAESTSESLTQSSLESVPEFRHTEDIPVVWRPQDVTSDSLLRMADMLKKREDALKENETRIEQEKSRLEFVFQDLQRERNELNALHDKISSRILEAGKILKEVESEHQQLDQQKVQTEKQLKDFEKDLEKLDANEQQNVAKLAEFYKEMPEATAARYLREMCDNGQIELAASVLDALEKRTATKILVELNDPVLVSQLMEKIKKLPAAESASRTSRTRR